MPNVESTNPERVAWSVREWCAAVSISPAYLYELLAAEKVKSVKVGNKRLIVTSPHEFVAQLADQAA